MKPEESYVAIGVGVQRIGKEYRAELSRIKWEAIGQARKSKRMKMGEKGLGEIQRLMGKKTPQQPQWGLLPRTAEFRYPSVIQLKEGGVQKVIELYGSTMEESVKRWEQEGDASWWELGQEGREVKIKLRKGEKGTELSFAPLTEIASFAERAAEMITDIVRDTAAIPWTTPTDKLSQLEFYFSRQSTAIGTHCEECKDAIVLEKMSEMWAETDEEAEEAVEDCFRQKGGRGQHVLPLSKIGEEGKREVVWWCKECGGIRPISTMVTPGEHPILEQLAEKQFDPALGLGGVLTRESFEYYLDQLPNRKASGWDNIPYEFIREAPPKL